MYMMRRIVGWNCILKYVEKAPSIREQDDRWYVHEQIVVECVRIATGRVKNICEFGGDNKSTHENMYANPANMVRHNINRSSPAQWQSE